MTVSDDKNPIGLPTGEEVYDAIMSKIEPELTSENLQKLEEMYAGETEEEKQIRADRYTKAFDEYDKQYAEYERKLTEVTNQSVRAIRKSDEASENVDADSILAA